MVCSSYCSLERLRISLTSPVSERERGTFLKRSLLTIGPFASLAKLGSKLANRPYILGRQGIVAADCLPRGAIDSALF